MTPESLARTIAKARHGTDAHWAHYVGAAREAKREVVTHILTLTESAKNDAITDDNVDALNAFTGFEYALRALIAQPDGAQSGEWEFERIEIETGNADIIAAYRHAYDTGSPVKYGDVEWLVTGFQKSGANTATIFTLKRTGGAQSVRPGLKREPGGMVSIDPTRFPFDEAEDY